MSAPTLTIDLDAIIANYRTLAQLNAGETAAVVKADGYGLDAGRVGQALTKIGVQSFFVALAVEGVTLRKAIGPAPDIYVFSGLMNGDAQRFKDHNLIPLLNSPDQVTACDIPFGLQLDSGMNRLGLEPHEFAAVKHMAKDSKLLISHLACADVPAHPQNAQQLTAFHDMTKGLKARKSLAATGGMVMGTAYHFDLCRPGVGLYGGEPFNAAQPVVTVDIPVIQTRDVAVGEAVGYAASFIAERPTKVATLALGYADGLIRAISNTGLPVWAGDQPCPIIGRVSMDLLTVDVTDLDHIPDSFQILNDHQTVDLVADAAGTIGYEILTSLGARYNRVYKGG